MWKSVLEYMPFLFSLLLTLKGKCYLAIHRWLLKGKNIQPSELRDVVFSETILSTVISPYAAIVYCTSMLTVSGKTDSLPWCVVIFIVQTIAASVTYLVLTPQRMVLLFWARWLPALLQVAGIVSCACVFYLSGI